MNNHRTFSAASVVFIALMAGLLFISAHDPSSDVSSLTAAHDTHHGALNTDHHEASHPYVDGHTHDDFALSDMYAYAALRLGAFRELPETFGETPDWYGWQLHWMDVEHDGEIVRIYHAAANQHHEIRFVTMWDSHEAHSTGWEPVH